MTNNRFWLYYSLVMAVGFYPVAANAGYMVLSSTKVCPANLSRNEGSCYSSSEISSVPAYVYKVEGTGTGMDVFDESCPSQNSLNNDFVSVLAAPTYFCQSCPSGFDLVSLELLIGTSHIRDYSAYNNANGLTAGVDFEWGTSGSFGEEIYDYCHNQGNICYFHTGEWDGMDPKVCVKCTRDSEPQGWDQYNTSNHSMVQEVIITNGCSGASTTELEYGCAAGTAYESGSGANIKCRVCNNGENCNPNDGHTSGVLSCKAGYYLDTSSGRCFMCGEGYYQPSNSNKGGASSCIPCPKYEDTDVQGNDVYGITDHMKDGASIWKDKCYVCDTGEDCEYLDAKGKYYYEKSCYWSGAAYAGS